MGTGQQINPPPAAVLSRPFYLAHRVAVLHIKPGQTPKPPPWKPGDPVKLPFTDELVPPTIKLPNLDAEFDYYRVVNRWLYVFQLRDNKWTWAGEYWVDEAGKYHPVDMKLAQGKERNKRPQPSKDAIPLLSLPYKINGKQVFNGFFLSGTRLPLQSIQRLEKEGWKPGELWMDLDKYDLDPDLYQGAYYIQDRAGQSFLRVKDQLWYTISLNKIMKQLRDLAVGWIVPAQDMDPHTRKRTEDRARKKLLAETIKSLLDKDPQDKLGLKNEFHSNPRLNYAAGGEEVMRQWLRDYDTTVEWWMTIVDEAARQLTIELNSRVMSFVKESYTALEKVDPKGYEQDMPLFLRESAECIDRITETPRGAAWIDGIIKDKNHWIHDYLLRPGPPEGVRFQVMRKSTAALLSIWSELPTRYILIHGRKSVQTLVDTLNYTALGTLIKDRAQITARNLILPGTTPVEKASHWQVGADGWTPTGRRIVKTEVITENITMIPDPKVENFTKVANKVFLAIELVNLTIGIQTLIEKGRGQGQGEVVWAAFGVIGSSLDATTAFGALNGWKKGTLLKLGAVSAVIDMILAAREASQSKDVGDISGSVGSGFVASGSALIAAGYAMSFFGAGTSWTGLGVAAGIIGAVMVVIGYIISLFTSDTALELFVAHSVWGHRYGLDSGDKPWSSGPFNGWHESRDDGLARQVAAMTNLLASFSVTGMRWKARIQFGMLHEKTKVQVKFATDFMDDHQEVEVVVDLANNRTRVVDTADPGRLDTGGTSPIYGHDYLELAMNFRDKSLRLPDKERQLFENDHEMDCWIRLDYYGDGSRMIPPSGKWVRYHTKALAVSKASSSQDY